MNAPRPARSGLLALACTAALSVACTPLKPFPPTIAVDSVRGDMPAAAVPPKVTSGRASMLATTEAAVARLADALPQPLQGARTLVTTVVDVNQVATSAPLGRALAELVAAAAATRGFKVVEIRMRDQLLLDEAQGELMLSRNSGEVAATQKAELVITGTYAAAAEVTYVSLKVLRASNGVIEAATTYELANSPDVLKLLQTTAR